METTDLKTLVAIHDINEVLKQYCRSMDRVDKELGYSVWHKDASVDYGEYFKGSGYGFIDWVSEVHLTLINHIHRITNVSIAVTGNTACSETYVIATHLVQPTAAPVLRFYYGRYLDQWSQKKGRWAIDARKFILEFAYVHQVDPSLEGTVLSSFGSRDLTDPYYKLFGTPRGIQA